MAAGETVKNSVMREGSAYRPDIDGLRAVAITAVVLFHVGVPGLAGGYVGVDIFFVISGFLITRMLVSEMEQTGQIDFVAFYARRVRRLLPALLAVILIVLILGTVLLSVTGEQQDLSRSAVATVAFVSNIYFWDAQSRYFAADTEWTPLLNMWTLSVEEQFYLGWPAGLVVAAFITRRSQFKLHSVIGITLIVVFFASFLLFLWGARTYALAAFYLMPTRAWQFAAGGALAVFEKQLGGFGRAAGPMAWVGTAAIGASILVPQLGITFPLAAVAATAGAGAIIASGYVPSRSFAIRMLQTAPFVTVGKLSYSWYLWHWPLLSLIRIHAFGERNRFRDLFVALAALGLAWLTYTFLEYPIRRRKPWPFSGAREALVASLVLSLALVGLAAAINMRANVTVAYDSALKGVYAALHDRGPILAGCFLTPRRFSGLAPAKDCLVGNVEGVRRVLVWGDSHAMNLIAMAAKHGTQNNYAGIVRTMSSCAPTLAAEPEVSQMSDNCSQFNTAVTREIPELAQAGLLGVVIASRGYGFRTRRPSSGSSGDAPPVPINWTLDAQQTLRWQGILRKTLTVAHDAGVRVLLVAPVPEYPYPVPRCLAHRTVEDCSVSRASVQNARAQLMETLRQTVAEFDNVRILDPINAICDERVCAPVHDGVVLYSDNNHLSLEGARYLERAAAPDLDWVVHER